MSAAMATLSFFRHLWKETHHHLFLQRSACNMWKEILEFSIEQPVQIGTKLKQTHWAGNECDPTSNTIRVWLCQLQSVKFVKQWEIQSNQMAVAVAETFSFEVDVQSAQMEHPLQFAQSGWHGWMAQLQKMHSACGVSFAIHFITHFSQAFLIFVSCGNWCINVGIVLPCFFPCSILTHFQMSRPFTSRLSVRRKKGLVKRVCNGFLVGYRWNTP